MSTLDQITQLFGGYGLNLVAALLILVVGWLVALLLSSGVRKALDKVGLNQRLANWTGGKKASKPLKADRLIAKIVYYIILLFVLLAFFQALNLTIITEPLNHLLTTIMVFVPRLLGAALLLLIAWILASLLKRVVFQVLSSAGVDEKLGQEADMEGKKQIPLSQTMANVVYWLVFLLFLPAILGSLALQGLLGPIQDMVDKILNFLPNIFAAVLILAIGWFIARIIQQIVANLLAAIGTDRLVERVGLSAFSGKQKLSSLIGLIVYVLVLIPVIIAAVDALNMEAITRPITNMLDTILNSLPFIFAALIVLAIAYIVGKLIAGLITSMLSGLGFDNVLAQLGIGKEPSADKRTPSQIVGHLSLIAIMLFATIEAADLLGFNLLADLIFEFMAFAGQIIMGLIILGIGIYLANLAYNSVKASGTAHANLLATAARISIMIFALAMALRQMGIANDIINLAFGLLLGATALAVALAFGLGGRDIAARELDSWIQSVKSKK